MHEQSDFSQAQAERLAYIDYCLEYLGEVNRTDLMLRFGISQAGATRDLAKYRELARIEPQLDHQVKMYRRPEGFEPVMLGDNQSRMLPLTLEMEAGHHQSSQLKDMVHRALYPHHPAPSLVATLTRAMHRGEVIRLRYHSLTSGETVRDVCPHALIHNGTRWHMRGFDRHSGSFRDFVVTRIESACETGNKSIDAERRLMDKQWNRICDLILCAHPKLEHKRGVELEFGISAGLLTLEVRAAQVGYLLRQWQVDCSREGTLDPRECQLRLVNPQALYGVENSLLAPGYDPAEYLTS